MLLQGKHSISLVEVQGKKAVASGKYQSWAVRHQVSARIGKHLMRMQLAYGLAQARKVENSIAVRRYVAAEGIQV